MAQQSKWIAIVGDGTLQGQLMQYALAHETGIPTTIEPTYQAFEQHAGDNPADSILCLVDVRSSAIDRVSGQVRAWNRTRRWHTTVACYNLHANDPLEQVAISQGVRGFFYVHDGLEQFVKGVEKLFDGEIWVPRELLFAMAQTGVSAERASEDDGARLTNREMQVLAHVCTGLSNDEISESLHLSPHTVKTHLYRIFKKIDVSNRFQASLWAAKHL